MRKIILLISVVFPITLFAQWSSDSNSATLIYKGYDVNDVELIDNYGRYYFSWVHRPFGGPDYRMIQQIDNLGFPMWMDSSNIRSIYGSFPNYSSWDQNIHVDKNSYLIVSQVRYLPNTHLTRPVITKTNQYGRKQWSVNTELYRKEFNAEGMKFCVSELQNIYSLVRWASITSSVSELTLSKVNEHGIIEWQIPSLILSNLEQKIGNDFQLFPTKDDGCIIIYSKQDVNWRNNKPNVISEELLMKKVSRNGKQDWIRDEIIFQKRGSIFGEKIVSQDKNGSIYLLWNEKPGMTVIQKINSDGSRVWGPTGQRFTELPVYYDYPIVSGYSKEGEITIIYSSTDNITVSLYLQKLTKFGDRILGSNGQELINLPYGDLRNAYAKTFMDTTILVYETKNYPNDGFQSIRAKAFDSQGIQLWNRTLKTNMESEKYISLQGLTSGIGGQFITSWIEFEGEHIYKVKAQNIHTDGTLGNKTTSINHPNESTIEFTGYDSQNHLLKFTGTINNGKYVLRNIMGQAISEGEIKSDIHLQKVNAGLYVLSFTDGQSQYSQKLFIQ